MRDVTKLCVLILLFLNSFIILNSQSISGTWTLSNGNFPVTMLLLENGTGEFQGLPIKYKVQNGKLTIDDGVQPVIYDYKLNQNSLLLTGGDLQVPVIFSRLGSTTSDTGTKSQTEQSSNQTMAVTAQQRSNVNGSTGNRGLPSDGISGLIGIWQGQQGKIIFYPDGLLIYNGTSYNYTSIGNSLTITGNDGTVTFNCSLTGNQLTLSQNASSSSYSKTGDLNPDRVDPLLVGKWCIISSSYNSYLGGGSSSEECIVLNADGTYQYFYSAERSAYAANQSAYGGTANQNSDHGHWKTDGMTLVSISQSTGKTNRYSLTKQNEQNGDPAIVVGGRKFVTAYNRQGW